eukprot:712240-Alexandrium_andersonii.AAC.1
MEALFASCSEEFQSMRNSQAQVSATIAGLQAELLADDAKLKGLDNSIGQQMSNFNQRISALESRPTGVQPAFAGGNPNP